MAPRHVSPSFVDITYSGGALDGMSAHVTGTASYDASVAEDQLSYSSSVVQDATVTYPTPAPGTTTTMHYDASMTAELVRR